MKQFTSHQPGVSKMPRLTDCHDQPASKLEIAIHNSSLRHDGDRRMAEQAAKVRAEADFVAKVIEDGGTYQDALAQLGY